MERTKLAWMVAAAFFLLMAGGLVVATSMHPGSALAQGEPEQVGRYQLSAWASYAGARVHHSGYYVLDTVSGKVVDSGHEVHGIVMGEEGEVE
jgi:hypothetical protein